MGTNWIGCARRVEGRTDSQCRERWLNVLDPTIKNPKVWDEEVSLYVWWG